MNLKSRIFNNVSFFLLKFYSIFLYKNNHSIKPNMIIVIVCKHDLIFKKKIFEIKLLNDLLKKIREIEKKDYYIIH